jgi:Family of unknown function (DUF6463)
VIEGLVLAVDADTTPASLPAGLTALGLWGVLLMPKSPFWVFPLFAALAALRRRTALRSRDG